jgi:bifunctional ADP-heptose synthase (sugar kinase/adenylyltransferase)
LFVLASLEVVDLVILFNDQTPIDLIETLLPTTLVKGADYDENENNPLSKKYIIGSDVVRANGGNVKTVDLEEGYSTTSLISKIKD